MEPIVTTTVDASDPRISHIKVCEMIAHDPFVKIALQDVAKHCSMWNDTESATDPIEKEKVTWQGVVADSVTSNGKDQLNEMNAHLSKRPQEERIVYGNGDATLALGIKKATPVVVLSDRIMKAQELAKENAEVLDMFVDSFKQVKAYTLPDARRPVTTHTVASNPDTLPKATSATILYGSGMPRLKLREVGPNLFEALNYHAEDADEMDLLPELGPGEKWTIALSQGLNVGMMRFRRTKVFQ